MKARLPTLSVALGPYIPLIVVNCLILGRQEMFASKNTPSRAVLDGLGAGSGFLGVLFLLGGVRELLGSGSFLGLPLMPQVFQPWLIMVLPGGAFFTLGVIMAIANAYGQHRERSERQARLAQFVKPHEEEATV
jgi:Na+-translocating ferredoxin:NAD+ oxidoreductase subunit E